MVSRQPTCSCSCEPKTTKGYRVSDGSRIKWEYCPECHAEGEAIKLGGKLCDGE